MSLFELLKADSQTIRTSKTKINVHPYFVSVEKLNAGTGQIVQIVQNYYASLVDRQYQETAVLKARL